MSRVHILTVVDARHFEISCLGLDDTCRAWVECNSPDCDFEELERQHYELGEDRPVMHGVEHVSLPTGFGVATEECFLGCDPGEAVEDFLLDNLPRGADPSGSYLVTHEVDGDTGDLGHLEMVTSWREIEPKEAVSLNLEQFPHTEAPLNELGEPCPWPWEPQQLVGVPLGQYHCGYCGGYAMAGVPHFDSRGLDAQLAKELEADDRAHLLRPVDLSDPFADRPPS